MIDGLLSWINTKGQVDFGNVAVGFGTFCVALVSWLTTKKTLALARKGEISKARKEWEENLRSHLAEYYSTCSIIEVNRQAKGDLKEFHALMKRVAFLDAYLRLLLNQKERDHAELVSQMETLLRTATTDNSFISDEQKSKFEDLARKILKSE